MHRFRLAVLVLCSAPAILPAADADVPLQCRPVAEADAPPPFEPTEGEPLSYAQQRDLRLLFAAAEGDWRGSAVDRVCMVAGNSKAREFQAELKVTSNRDGLRISGEYRQIDGSAKWRFQRQLFLTPDGLRVDQRGRAGEVTLTDADRHSLAYVQRYRTLHSLPGGAAAAAASGDAPGQVGGTVGAPSVAGSDNIVTEPDTAPSAPPPKRRSVMREERFSLQLIDSRRLVLVQDFFIQGAYSGTMRWDLRRR